MTFSSASFALPWELNILILFLVGNETNLDFNKIAFFRTRK